jgi:four helix bundle protein
MAPYRRLAVLDAAEQVVVEVNTLIDSGSRRLLYVGQLRDSAQSVSANIAEGFGRGEGADRNRSLRIARGEAEETIRHLRANRGVSRIDDKSYWHLHHRLTTIVKMLNSLLK